MKILFLGAALLLALCSSPVSSAPLAAPFDLAALLQTIRAGVPPSASPATRIPTDELDSLLPATFGNERFSREFTYEPEQNGTRDAYKAPSGAEGSVRLIDFFHGNAQSTLHAVQDEAQGLAAALQVAQKQSGLSVRIVPSGPGQIAVEQTRRQTRPVPSETSVITVFVAGRYMFEVRVLERGQGGHSLAWARDAVKQTRLDLLARATRSSENLAGTASAIEEKALKIMAAQMPGRPKNTLRLPALLALLPARVGEARCRPDRGFGSEGPPGVVCRTQSGVVLGTVAVYDAAQRSGPWPRCLFVPDDEPSWLYPDGSAVFVPHGAALLQPARHVTGFTWAFVSGGQLFENANLAVDGRYVYNIYTTSPAALQQMITALLALRTK